MMVRESPYEIPHCTSRILLL